MGQIKFIVLFIFFIAKQSFKFVKVYFVIS